MSLPKCRKRKYRSEIDAKIVLARIQAKDSSTRGYTERRVYYHTACHAWHLTSMNGGNTT